MFRTTFSKAADHCRTTLNSMIVKRNAGHSKWSNIKHIKGANDQQKSLTFARFSRQMKLAIRGKIRDINTYLALDTELCFYLRFSNTYFLEILFFLYDI